MKPKDFIEKRLEELNNSDAISNWKEGNSLEEEIYRLVFSKKFRKYSANDDLKDHCRHAIQTKVANNEPINITFLHGAYKLWRLDESPYADWAELFALMYYTNWVKGICEIYEPGVVFDFFVDDWIVEEMNNVPINEVNAYLESYYPIFDFLKQYQPSNLHMTVTPVGSLFESREQFIELLYSNLEELHEKGLPDLNDSQITSIELNVKTTPEQEQNPYWREKVWQLHKAYLKTKKSLNYHGRPEKILAFTQPLPSGTTISVGTTKNSVTKFWVGVGALQPKDDSYMETILSPSKLQNTDFQWNPINLNGLSGENFKQVRVLD